MRKATKKAATFFGVIAGLAGIEHGIFEVLQGNARPESLMTPSMGPPCAPEKVWNACEPAMTILPNFLATGILAILIGLAMVVWSAAFLERKNGGAVMILLSGALLLFGGGIFPPLIGMTGGVAGTKIHSPVSGKPAGGMIRFLAKLWPGALVVFVVWILGQWVVGYFFNDFLQKNGIISLLLILVLLPVSVLSAYAQDVLEGEKSVS
jgi:hypothetical protein